MTRIELEDGRVFYDEYEDLRGNQQHKNIEKAHGPGTIYRRCPLCDCIKSFDPDIPNNVLYGCDGECPCHDGLNEEIRYAATG